MERAEDLRWAVEGPPIGAWETASRGGFDVVMGARFAFAADGTGRRLTWSALFGEEQAVLRWEHPEPGTLHIHLIDAEDPQAPPEWEIVRYEASVMFYDTDRPLFSVLNDAGDPTSFWTNFDPLRLISHDPGSLT